MRFPNDQLISLHSGFTKAHMRVRRMNEICLPIGLAKRHPLAWSKCAIKVGLRGTLYQMHTDSNDPLLMADFNDEGWTRFFRRTAMLLQSNSVMGVIGASWFYDPALREVSPRLTYLRSLILDNGGISMKLGTSTNEVESATEDFRDPKTPIRERRLSADGLCVDLAERRSLGLGRSVADILRTGRRG